MAFPTVRGRQSSSRGSNATTHDVALPVTPNAGDLIVIQYATDGSSSSGWSTTATNGGAGGPFTYTAAFADELNSGGNNAGVRYRVASGSETSPQRFTTSSSEHFTARAYVIQAGTFNASNPLEAARAEANTANPDPPSLTPTWGALDTLWITGYGADLHNVGSAGPTSYSNFVNIRSATSGTDSCSMSVADRELNTATENPGTFTMAAENHVEWTLAIQPASGGGATHNGAAALTGTGSLSATGVRKRLGTAALSGTGSLSATGIRKRTGTVALTGTGTLSATARVTSFAQAALSGSGTLTGTGVRTRFGSASLTGTGAITASGTRSTFGAATLTGTGTLTATGVRTRFGVANLTGTGSLTATGVRTRFGAASLTGTGSLTATGNVVGGAVTHQGSAALTGVGSLTASGIRTRLGSAALTGAGSLAATGLRITLGSAALSGTSTLTAVGIRRVIATAQLTGIGTLTATAAGAGGMVTVFDLAARGSLTDLLAHTGSLAEVSANAGLSDIPVGSASLSEIATSAVLRDSLTDG